MTKINWDIVDRNVFTEFRFTNSVFLAAAYVAEAHSENPSDTRLVTLYEMGQGCFSVVNNRQQREELFMQSVRKANAEMVGA